MNFRRLNLLVITELYPNQDASFYLGAFVKGQVDELKKYFNKVFVISPQAFGHRKGLKNYSYDNVHVYYPRFFHIPIRVFRERLGENFYKAALRVINQEGVEFDLIHAHFTWPSGYAGVKLGKKFGVPAVITIHENREWFMQEYNSGNEKIYWTWRNANALIRVNKKDVPLLQKFNSAVYSIPNGFNPEKFKVIPRDIARWHLDISQDKKIVFGLGALIERKGFQYLVEAMVRISKVRKDVLCFIGGSGPLKEKLQRQIESLGLQEYVKLLGSVPDDQLVLWMNAADLFVLPSLSEGNPTVMFEALGVGLPFIGTTVGGIPEIITSEDYGLLCPPQNPECLAEKILIALDKEWDREKIRKYAEQFTWEKITKAVLRVLSTLI